MPKKNIVLIIAIILIASLIGYLELTKSTIVKPAPTKNNSLTALAPELAGISGFINTPGNQPITIKSLIGKRVILVDFWTYSCINCQRTTPYLNDWYRKYHAAGLEIIGVHTPEFEFEKDYSNVSKAVAAEGIKYPVVLDNASATWQAYGNRFWPRRYLIDQSGQIVYDHIGEGAYAETEAKIQALLKLAAESFTLPADPASNLSLVKSPEIYFGANRQDPANNITLIGPWTSAPEFITAAGAGNITYRYDAKNVYLVAAAGEPTEVAIYIDGIKIKTIMIKDETLYPLVSGQSYGQHELKIETTKAGLRLYTLTFG